VKKKYLGFSCVMFIVLMFGVLAGTQERPFLRVSVADSSYLYRVLIESSFPFKADFEKEGALLIIKIGADRSVSLQKGPSLNRFIKSLSWAQEEGFSTLTIEAADERFNYDSFSVENPPQLFVNLRPEEQVLNDLQKQAAANDPPSQPINSEKVPLAQRRRTVVIDPGHGGLETGAKGKFGALEKDITLSISKKLKTIIERNLAFNVELTRDEDVEVSLEQRTALANYHDAFLFISIHANSSFRKKARGPETYFLSLNATDRDARRLAYLENNESDIGDKIFGQDEDNIKMILWDMAQSAYLKQSSMLADKIQDELNSLLRTKNRGIKQAPFFVLAGVACPAVLVETAFLSDAGEEKKLVSEVFQRQLAQAIFRGLVRFIREYSNE
jgi:N-acetylmuramoyl-L-alanine amidase